jgi:hypothetical protein
MPLPWLQTIPTFHALQYIRLYLTEKAEREVIFPAAVNYILIPCKDYSHLNISIT